MSSKQTEALKLALEWIEAQPEPRMLGALKTITAIREALTEQPASKPWVGLTDEEARTLVDRHCGTLLAVSQVLDRMQLTRTIEDKLREKNQ